MGCRESSAQREEKRSKIHNIAFHFKELAKEEQTKPKATDGRK